MASPTPASWRDWRPAVRVHTVQVYRWDLPVDTGPLEANVRAIAAGTIDAALFTSSHQVVNLLRVAERLQLTTPLRSGMARALVASIGPTTSETLAELDFHVDVEPEHSKMGQLVAAAAQAAARCGHRARRDGRSRAQGDESARRVRNCAAQAPGTTSRSCRRVAGSRLIACRSG